MSKSKNIRGENLYHFFNVGEDGEAIQTRAVFTTKEKMKEEFEQYTKEIKRVYPKNTTCWVLMF